jgi:small-conductance mechanosensitive channel
VITAVLAWLAALAVCVAAVLVGQSVRTAPRRRRRRRSARIGLFLSLSGPWLSVLAALGYAALTGAWIPAAAAGAVAVTVVALTGLVLAPR